MKPTTNSELISSKPFMNVPKALDSPKRRWSYV
jgi:hypothetical protein